MYLFRYLMLPLSTLQYCESYCMFYCIYILLRKSYYELDFIVDLIPIGCSLIMGADIAAFVGMQIRAVM